MEMLNRAINETLPRTVLTVGHGDGDAALAADLRRPGDPRLRAGADPRHRDRYLLVDLRGLARAVLHRAAIPAQGDEASRRCARSAGRRATQARPAEVRSRSAKCESACCDRALEGPPRARLLRRSRTGPPPDSCRGGRGSLPHFRTFALSHSMQLIDAHAHLADERILPEVDEVVARARGGGAGGDREHRHRRGGRGGRTWGWRSASPASGRRPASTRTRPAPRRTRRSRASARLLAHPRSGRDRGDGAGLPLRLLAARGAARRTSRGTWSWRARRGCR